MADLVDGLTKLTDIPFEDREEESIENLRKMFLAMSKDIRVIFIKLCIEETKLDFIDKYNEIELNKYMQEVTDIYFPICQKNSTKASSMT